MDAKTKMLEQLSAKLHKRAAELDHDAARLNGIGRNLTAERLRDIAADMRIVSNGL